MPCIFLIPWDFHPKRARSIKNLNFEVDRDHAICESLEMILIMFKTDDPWKHTYVKILNHAHPLFCVNPSVQWIVEKCDKLNQFLIHPNITSTSVITV